MQTDVHLADGSKGEITEQEGAEVVRCSENPHGDAHEWVKRTDSMGDPNGRYGESTWQIDVCSWCGIEQQEINEPHDHVTEIVGHKTLRDKQGRTWHEPLTRGEGDAMMAAADAELEARAAAMPDEQTALCTLFSAYQRLCELGWREAIYCPKDGTWFDAIEAGSTGIHDCSYWGEWPSGGWHVADEGDLWPSHPVLFRLRATETSPRDSLQTASKSDEQDTCSVGSDA